MKRIVLWAAPGSDNVKSLTELARLYEKKLITLEEYEKAKKDIFGIGAYCNTPLHLNIGTFFI